MKPQFEISKIEDGNFKDLYCIRRLDALSAFVGSYAAIQKLAKDWTAAGISENNK